MVARHIIKMKLKMPKSDTKLLLLSGSDTLNVKVLYCLYPRFKNIHVVAESEDSLVKYTRYKKKFAWTPWKSGEEDQEKSVAFLQNYCRENEIEVILPGDLDASGFIEKYKNAFSDQQIFPTMSAKELERLDNKWLFGQRVAKAGLKTPESILIDDSVIFDERLRDEIENNICFPLILKPLFGEASEGIRKLDSYDHLSWYIQNELGTDKLPVLLQTYIDGYDAGYSVIAENGNIKVKAVQLVKQPDVIEYCSHERIEALGEKIVKLVNYSGAANFDLRLDYKTDEIYILECNPRFWFTIASAMWQGLNFPEAAVQYVQGKDFKKEGACGIIFSPGRAIKPLLKKPWLYFSYSKSQRRYIWQVILDPVFHVNKIFKL